MAESCLSTRREAMLTGLAVILLTASAGIGRRKIKDKIQKIKFFSLDYIGKSDGRPEVNMCGFVEIKSSGLAKRLLVFNE